MQMVLIKLIKGHLHCKMKLYVEKFANLKLMKNFIY